MSVSLEMYIFLYRTRLGYSNTEMNTPKEVNVLCREEHTPPSQKKGQIFPFLKKNVIFF